MDLSEAAPTTPTTTDLTVVQRLQGGIGNQLFQMLYAQRVAQANGAQLAFDITAFARDGFGRRSVLHRLWPEAAKVDAVPADSARLLREADMAWPADGDIPERFSIPAEVRHVVLDGYWQDRRVVSPEALTELRHRLEGAMPPAVQQLAERVRSTARPTSVHVRRHDYKHHGLASEAYYIDSLRWLSARAGGLDIFVFSDEPNYTAAFLSQAGIRAQIVSTGDDLADLYVMAQCSRHVISNSTYSWWGAMLSGSDDVVWPDPWSQMHQPSAQLCPPRWKRIAGAVERTNLAPRFATALEQEQFRIDRETFFSQGQLPPDWQVQLRPCLGDATAGTDFDTHYVYHTAWAARRLFANPVALHTDISSDIRFIALASAFQPMRFLDHRPATIQLANLECGRADLLNLDMPDGSVPSLSCMHVVEHMGLGRYGEPINFHGAAIAMRELSRVLTPGGLLYFVVPVGQPKVVFNAHRVFRARDIVADFDGLELLEFSLVDDQGNLMEHVALEAADTQSYGCGCFLFKKTH